MPYLLVFCHVTIGVTFMLSFASKVRNIVAFKRAIARFGIIPQFLSRTVAYLVLAGEAVVVLLAVAGGPALLLSFALASVLLLVFSVVLVRSLLSHADVVCNCFGEGESRVTYANVWRNAALVLCSLTGWALLARDGARGGLDSVVVWALVAPPSTIFALVWTQVGMVASLFRSR